jgi:uracil-DNA glycosylase family 4
MSREKTEMPPKTRAEKLTQLQQFCNLETGELDKSQFGKEFSLLDKAVAMTILAGKIKRCRKCEGLNLTRMTEGAAGWGNLNADVMFVGQSLHEPGMVSQIPFIGGSGLAIIAALRLSGLERGDCFWTNTVHCHPERNRRSSEEEKKNCLRFLYAELSIVRPSLIVAMGNDAKEAMMQTPITKPMNGDATLICIKHPASFMYAAPEKRVNWIVKLSLEIDKCLK